MNKKIFSSVCASAVAFVLVIVIILGTLCGCQSTKNPEPAELPVTLTIAGGWNDCRAIEAVGREFTSKYPNCTVVYEYLQDYSVSLPKRMENENKVDIFFTTNIQENSEFLPYALDLNSVDGLDLSNSFDGLIENFTFRDESSEKKLYAIPLGAELRGLYVNKTLLDSLNIKIPKNQEETLEACRVLKENGYIPFHGNPSDFGKTLVYPWICNIVANSENPQQTHEMINSRAAGIGALFEAPFKFMYTLIENDYYDYKKVQTEDKLFLDVTSEAYARDFFNIAETDDGFVKKDDLGKVAFLPSTLSLKGIFDKTKDDYHSGIEYIFMLAPIGDEGGYAYMSPAHGIAINKNSDNLDWSVKFLDFLFKPETNELFAKEFNIIPNDKDAFNYINRLYEIPDNRISHLGQVTFDYGFYNIIADSLVEMSKANNPKYMKAAEDGSVTLYPVEYYMGKLEERFTGNDEQE